MPYSLFFFEFTRFPVQDKSQTLSSICPSPFDDMAKIENVFGLWDIAPQISVISMILYEIIVVSQRYEPPLHSHSAAGITSTVSSPFDKICRLPSKTISVSL